MHHICIAGTAIRISGPTARTGRTTPCASLPWAWSPRRLGQAQSSRSARTSCMRMTGRQDGRRPGSVLTVHNLAYQGLFPADLRETLKLPLRSFAIDGVEYYGSIGFL